MLLKEEIKEGIRPTLYRGLKYWGKKPHNIWREIIKQNSSIGDVVYDPFAGSALTFFESIKTKRKPVICDINPLTLFLVDLYSKDFNLLKIKSISSKIINNIKETNLYKKNFLCECTNCRKKIDIYNYRWLEDMPKYLSYKCQHCKKTQTVNNDFQIFNASYNLWKPSFDLNKLSSISPSFINKIGNNDISALWTSRNLEILSLLFDEIIKVETVERDALMFGFIQILHLTTKMCALRGDNSNRPLSTSWGRPAFLGLKNFMEQNPLVQFERAINGNTGVIKCLSSRNEYLPKYTYSTNIKDINKVDGIVLLKDSKEVMQGFAAKLILTDPPYGPIIQYGELSQVWNIWLEKYDTRYFISLDKEIIVNKNKNYIRYISDMSLVLNNCHNLLTNKGNIILTYNSNKNEDWEALNKAISNSLLCVQEKRIQENKRSSEANVNRKEGIGISDYYFSLTNKLASGWS